MGTLPTTLTRTAVDLTVTSPDVATSLEEWLWTIPGVESVAQRLDGEEHFLGLEVIGVTPHLADQVQALLHEHGLSDHVQIAACREIHEEDWAESWKQYWHVNRILPNLVIQPSWEPFTPEPGDIILQLDPGSAFGTGTHETTQLVLSLMADLVQRHGTSIRTCLDVGTGSGILAVYAAKCSIPTCLALDNDPHAVQVAQANVNASGVADRVTCSTQSVREVPSGAFDLVVANILAPVLAAMMADLRNALAPGGHLILSGITRKQFQEMADAINGQRLTLTRILQKGEWLALVCQKPV